MADEHENLDELLAEFLAQNPAAADSLAQRLEGDPQARRQVAEEILVHRLLQQAGRATTDVAAVMRALPAEGESTAARVMASIQARRALPLRRSRPFVWAASAAAGILILLGIWQLTGRRLPKAEPIARLVELGNDLATVERSSQSEKAAAGGLLYPADLLSVAGSGSVKLQYLSDATTLTVHAQTKLRVDQHSGRKQVALLMGEVDAEIPKQAPGTAFELSTPEAHITVVGTRLRVRAEAQSTRVEVQEGLVRVQKTADGAQLDVGPAQAVLIQASTPLKLTTAGSAQAQPATENFLVIYDAEAQAVWMPEKGNGGTVSADPASPGHQGKYALALDYDLSALGAWGNAYFRLSPQDWRAFAGIEFWFRGTGRGDQFTFEVLDDNATAEFEDQHERFVHGFNDVSSEWRLIRIRWEQFERRKDWQPKFAKNDGFNRSAVAGIGVFLPTGKKQRVYLDTVRLFKQ